MPLPVVLHRKTTLPQAIKCYFPTGNPENENMFGREGGAQRS